MNYLGQGWLKLQPRNEGKLKSYESCNDIRAWSHDVADRDRYLREWMKSDMPFCVLPVNTLAGFLRVMTCKSRGKTSPRCHPDCKSKVLLDSICNSCHAIKECLKSDENNEKYFVEEDLETSHWPCERCLEALKSIKMFWKILVEKIFNINVSKHEVFENTCCSRPHSIRDIAKMWQRDMLQQAVFVKAISSQSSCYIRVCGSKSSCSCKQKKCINTCRTCKPCVTGDAGGLTLLRKASKCTINSNRSNRVTILEPPCWRSQRKKLVCTSVGISKCDFGCNTCEIVKENEELRAHKMNLDYLQNRYNLQRDENNKLKKENTSLKIELKNVYKTCKWKLPYCSPDIVLPTKDNIYFVPEPFETCLEECSSKKLSKETESEMIITMKNCKNESFKHISLLQVLHKTNDPIVNEINIGPCYQQEDPRNLLTKVQHTLGVWVKRELSVVNGQKHSSRNSEIEASFRKVQASRSAPSCSTLSSGWGDSQTNCIG